MSTECKWQVQHMHRHESPNNWQWQKLWLTVIARDGDKIIPPRTKKNSPRIIPGLKHPILLPSKAYKIWEKAATVSMLKCCLEMNRYRLMGLTDSVNVEAKIYRDRDVGDTNGFTQAIGDWLEHAGILVNDRQIDGWDGTERLKDAACPRLELCITWKAAANVKKVAKPRQALSGGSL